MNETPTGHARAKNFGFTPIVRMGNIYIDKGNSTLEEMIGSIDSFYQDIWLLFSVPVLLG